MTSTSTLWRHGTEGGRDNLRSRTGLCRQRQPTARRTVISWPHGCLGVTGSAVSRREQTRSESRRLRRKQPAYPPPTHPQYRTSDWLSSTCCPSTSRGSCYTIGGTPFASAIVRPLIDLRNRLTHVKCDDLGEIKFNGAAATLCRGKGCCAAVRMNWLQLGQLAADHDHHLISQTAPLRDRNVNRNLLFVDRFPPCSWIVQPVESIGSRDSVAKQRENFRTRWHHLIPVAQVAMHRVKTRDASLDLRLDAARAPTNLRVLAGVCRAVPANGTPKR